MTQESGEGGFKKAVLPLNVFPKQYFPRPCKPARCLQVLPEIVSQATNQLERNPNDNESMIMITPQVGLSL